MNIAGSYRLRGSSDGPSSIELFGAINNLFDRDPPIAPGGNGYPTNPVYFDTYGAAWKVGVRVQVLSQDYSQTKSAVSEGRQKSDQP